MRLLTAIHFQVVALITIEAVPQLILTTKKSLLLGFKALFIFLFLVFLDCWTASIVINIAVNGFFAFHKFYVGGRTRSISLVADAYHTKTDIWSSVAVLVGLLGATMGFFALDAIAGAVVSFFILFGGYELIKESNKMIHGGDPKLEKFAKLLENQLKALPVMGALTSLWFFSLQEMTKEDNLERVKKGLGEKVPNRARGRGL